MSSESDLDVLTDGIAKLQDELVPLLSGEDKAEIEALLELTALLELALAAYAVIQARVKSPAGASRRRSDRPTNLQWPSTGRPSGSCYGLRVAK
jgi:hypothetical protein